MSSYPRNSLVSASFRGITLFFTERVTPFELVTRAFSLTGIPFIVFTVSPMAPPRLRLL